MLFILHYCLRYVDEFTATAGRPEFRTKKVTDDQIIGNPLQAFQLIKRLTIDWSSVKSIMNDASVWQSKYFCFRIFFIDSLVLLKEFMVRIL